MKKIDFLAGLVLMSAPLLASEVEDYCALVKAQADTKANGLSWPNLFANFGNPYLVSSPTIAFGVNQSLAGFVRGLLTSDAAYYDCRFYGANKAIMDSVVHLDDRIYLQLAEVQRPLLTEALKLAEENLEAEKRLLEARDSTVAELTTAWELRDKIHTALMELETKASVAREAPVADTTLSLSEQVNIVENAQAKSASLQSWAEALSTWDVVGQGGLQTNLSTGHTGGFWSINLTYSFGQIPATLNASSVDKLYRQYTGSRYDSPQNAYRRMIKIQSEAYEREIKNNKYLNQRLSETSALLKKVSPLESLHARRLQRNLKIQALLEKSELAGSAAKMTELERITSSAGAK